MPRPKAVLLDVGGVLLLPSHDHMLGALARGGFTGSSDTLDRAHYEGAARLDADAIAEGWPNYWRRYIDAYITSCEVPDDLREAVHEHLDSEFAVAAVWTQVAPGAREGLRALAETGVRMGIISNADGTIEQQLRDLGLAQVGDGPGVAVECIIDSTVAGVAKPDPAIFRLALDAMGIAPEDAWYVGDTPAFDIAGARAAGLRPIVMDPYHLHDGADYERVSTLREVAELVDA
jgi:putative hydrolase of the HAD superfamily